MPVVHLAAVDALKGKPLADDVVHIYRDGLVAQTQQADLTAGTHYGEHLVKNMTITAHFQADIEALYKTLLLHDPGKVFTGCIDGCVNAHFFRQLQTIVVDVGDDDTTGTCEFTNAGGHDTNGTRTGDQYVLANQIPHQRGMGGIAESIEECNNIFIQVFIDGDNVACRNHQIFSEGTVAVYAHTLGVLTPLDVAVVTVAAVAAGNVTFTTDPLAYIETGDAVTQTGNFTDIFMSNGLTGLYMLRGPIVPQINMDIGPADSGLVYFNQNLTGTGDRYGDFSQFQTGTGRGFYNCIH